MTKRTRPFEARATINLRGMRAGTTAIVDPTDPYVAHAIDAEYLVPVSENDEDETEATEAETPVFVPPEVATDDDESDGSS